jgi:hypothetical protein
MVICMKPVATSICLAIAFLIPAAADAQWGAALGAGVDQMNRQRELGLQRQQSELMQQQLESQMRIQEIEQRRYQMELEDLQREREARKVEFEKQAKINSINRLFAKTIDEYGDVGRIAVKNVNDRTDGGYVYLSYSDVEVILNAELDRQIAAQKERMKVNTEYVARFMDKHPQYKNQKNKDLLGKQMEMVMADFKAGIGPGYADMYELLVLSHKRLLKSMQQGQKKLL